MTAGPETLQVPGYSLLRLLADRERSKLFLARDAFDALCAVKLQKPREPGQLTDLVKRDARLQPLTREEGLLEILAHGATEEGWVWKALPLADNLPGLEPVDSAAGLEQYTPLNFLAWRIHGDHAPPTARRVAEWGVRLANALAVLHDGGLVHRDVKPANVLLFKGQPCLGDYGLVGAPGDKVDYRGTEGFQPLEGTSDTGADLYALGKTLYETWTGGNRLEFPSLPREVLDAPDWSPTGSHLNEVILRACHPQVRKRFRSARELSAALANVVSGHRPINRRRWLLAAASGLAAGGGVFAFLKHRSVPAHVVWRRLRDRGFNVESWQGHQGTADWDRGRLYSFAVEINGRILQSVDLSSFALEEKQLTAGPIQPPVTLLQPQTRELWIIEGGRGEVFTLNLDTLALRSLGGGPCDRRHFSALTYWNPVTNRAGVFGGYGFHAVRNDRAEFDPVSQRWVELEPDRDSQGPWRRGCRIPLLPDPSGKQLFLVGGRGSLTGEQGKQMPGLREFDGHFHRLDDLWQLDLQTNTWKCLLPLGHFDPIRLHAAAYFRKLEGLVIFEGFKGGDAVARPAGCWLFRPGIDTKPVRLPASGDISRLAQAWAFTIDPQNDELLMLADDGIFRIAVHEVN